MWKATLRGLAARKVRLLLTALAVLLGVSFVTATYVLTDSVKQSFDAAFRQTVAGVDLQVQGAGQIGAGDPPPVPASVLQTVRDVPGVAAADGFVTGTAQFVDRDGDAIGGGGPPTFGVSWTDVGPFRLERGRIPAGPDEVAMDSATAREFGFAPGDRVRVLLDGPARALRVVGLFDFGSGADFGSVTFAAFDLETAQRVLGSEGSFDRIYIAAAPGESLTTLRDRVAAELGDRVEVLTPDEAARSVGRPVRSFLEFFTFALLGFAAIGVVVGAFVIFNTFTILVTQRTRELGLLRAMGASGRQVVVSVVLEALVVGVLASVIGIVAGVGLGTGLLELLRALGLRLPATSTVLQTRTVVISAAVGVLVTVAAALLPAVRAARIPPIAALAAAAERPTASLARRARLGGVILVISVIVVGVGLARAGEQSGIFQQIQVVALGAFGVLVGVVLLLAVVARPLAGLFGAPLRALGPSGVLARANAMRNPRRTAVTASALVIGLALVGLTATFGASAKESVRRDTADGIRADLVVKTSGFNGFSADVAARVADLPEVTVAAPVRFVDGVVAGETTTVAGLDPTEIDQVLDLGYVSGGADRLQGDSVLIDEQTAARRDLEVGDRVELRLARGAREVTVAGVYRNEHFIGIFGQAVRVVAPAAELGLGDEEPQASMVLVRARGEGAPAVRRAAGAMDDALGVDFPNVEVLSAAEFRTQQQDQVDRFLTVLVAILLLSELIAILGIVNTLALSVFERTRELGLLRVIGMSRRQVRRMVRGEAIVIAALGAVVGVGLGVLWGWWFVAALADQGVSVFVLPVTTIAWFLLGAVLAGVLAAVVPAWRASRLDVLEAIATE